MQNTTLDTIYKDVPQAQEEYLSVVRHFLKEKQLDDREVGSKEVLKVSCSTRPKKEVGE
jgi:hypothetical protein